MCPICCSIESDREAVYKGPWKEDSKLYRCRNCSTWYLSEKNTEEIKQHFEKVIYNDKRFEGDYYKERYDLFRYIADRIINLYKIHNWVEIGPGYGHLMEILRNYGNEVYGVEISESRSFALQQKNFKIYKEISDIDLKDGGVILIDCFYYFQKPYEFFDNLPKKYSVLIMRVINRCFAINVYNTLFPNKTIPRELFGDALFSPTVKGITSALKDRDFNVDVHIEPPHLKVKGASLKKKSYYYLTTMLSKITGHIITPGYIIQAYRK